MQQPGTNRISLFIAIVSIRESKAANMPNIAVASNSTIASSHGLADPVRAQLIKSFCLHLLLYCIGALKLKRSMIQELSVCWNNVFRCIFRFKKWEPIRVLQHHFGTLDFMHLYDLYRWKLVHAMNNNGAYWSKFVNIFGIKHHELLYITDNYNDGNMLGSVAQ